MKNDYNKSRYYVFKDLQNTDFAMNRYYTIEQWQKQALEWCFVDDNKMLAKYIYKLPHNQILKFIEEVWLLKFRKCRKDKKSFARSDFEDFEDETLKQYYKARF